MKQPDVVKKPAVVVKPTPVAEQTVTLMGVAKDGDKYRAVEVTLPLSATKPLRFGNRVVGMASWQLARNQCDLEQRRRFISGFRAK